MDPLHSLEEEPVSRLNLLPLLAVAPTHTVRQAVGLMQAERHGYVVVCEGKRPVGILTERDVLLRMGTFQPLDVPVEEVISGQVWTVGVHESVRKAIDAMNEHQCRHLVVVSPEGDATGVVSVRGIMRALVEHFPASVYNLPPIPRQVPTDREGA